MRIILLLLCSLFVSVPALSQRPEAPGPLPVRQVTLFTSGVSYIERGGEVDGDAAVPLVFRVGQINDILKSLVLLDGKGQVRPAVYAAQDPLSRTLQSFAVDVTQNLTQMEALSKLRGAEVRVEIPRQGALTGRIVGVEMRPEIMRDGRPVQVPYLTVLGDRGLTTVRLESGTTVRLLDERLNREFQQALGLLATGSDEQRRQVMLHFAGEGKRPVRVGYVTEAPLWKMSYRLLLGAKEAGAAGKPYMQGWALVENTTDEDWNNVALSLVSGRPISFIQDLYQPLYIPRPVVPPDVIASPYPQTHAGDLLRDKAVAATEPAAPALKAGVQLDRARRAGRPLGENGAGGPPAEASDEALGFGGGFGGRTLDSAALAQSVSAQAAGQSAGELFAYNITTPVSLPRRQGAMIPVIAQDIGAEKVSLFNPDTTGRFALNAVRIRNSTNLHLKGGPVTLFDEGVYAGDAKMEDIPPGDTRLVSYAVDLAIEGERQGQGITSVQETFSLKRGVLVVTRRERHESTYTLKSKADKPRQVLVEVPFDPSFNLVSPEKAEERTADRYRFAVAVPPGASETLKLVFEKPLSQTIAVLDADLNLLAGYATRQDVSPKVRESLQEVVKRRQRVQELQAQAAAREQEIGTIMQDQERVRKNMEVLDRNSALYKRYVGDLDQQETRIQALRKEAAQFRSQAQEAERDLRTYVDSLEI